MAAENKYFLFKMS